MSLASNRHRAALISLAPAFHRAPSLLILFWCFCFSLSESSLRAQGTDPERPSPQVPRERLEQRGSNQWHILRLEGREYVRFEDIQSFYRFPTMDVIGDEVILESPTVGLSMRFLKDTQRAHFNHYQCYLSFPPCNTAVDSTFPGSIWPS